MGSDRVQSWQLRPSPCLVVCGEVRRGVRIAGMLMQEIDDQAGTGEGADDFPDGMYPLVRHLIRQSERREQRRRRQRC